MALGVCLAEVLVGAYAGPAPEVYWQLEEYTSVTVEFVGGTGVVKDGRG